MIIKGVQKTSLIDYPGNICTVFFVAGCNLRCPYCHNAELLNPGSGLPTLFQDEALAMVESRKKLIDGVCITGGEPMIHPGLPEFCAKLKDLGLLVKVDTNGTNPVMLDYLIKNRLVDYIAMDVKAPLENYHLVGAESHHVEALEQSIKVVLDSGIDHEFRTTAAPGIVDVDSMAEIARTVKGAKRLAIQQFRNKGALDPEFRSVEPYSRAQLEEMKRAAEKHVESCDLRNA